MRKIDRTGQRYGRLLVMRMRGSNGRTPLFECRCDCGETVTVTGAHLQQGSTRSCGCLARERVLAMNTKHGMKKRGDKPPEWNSWSGAIARCFNPRCKQYKFYGARGISVCARWRNSFAAFMEDMGPRPSNHHSVDRIDVNGDYEPSNCRWATAIEQGQNRRAVKVYEIDGIVSTLGQHAMRHGLPQATVFGRLRRGLTPIEAVTNPVNKVKSAASRSRERVRQIEERAMRKMRALLGSFYLSSK